MNKNETKESLKQLFLNGDIKITNQTKTDNNGSINLITKVYIDNKIVYTSKSKI